MAGGKLTPRQKMINLMYLVFIAMLALNMSKEVLSAFGMMNEKFEATNETSILTNDQMLAALDAKASEAKGDFIGAALTAHKVEAATKKFYDFVATAKAEVLKGVEPEDGKLPYEEMDKADNLNNSWFASTGLSPRGKSVMAAIETYKAEMSAALGTETKYASVLNQVNNAFNLSDVANKDGIKVKFLEYHFQGFEAIVVLDKNAYFQGEKVTGKVVLGKYDPNAKFSDFKGPGKLENGQAVLSMVAGGVGEQKIGGSFNFMENGKPINLPFKGTYVVVPRPNSATISADKMNVVYRGVVNPMTISFAGISDNDVSASANGLSKAGGNGKYNMSPDQGNEVVISVTGKLPDGTSVTDKKAYRIKNIPAPQGAIAGTMGESKGAKGRLAVSQISAILPDFDFDVKFRVTQFTFKVSGQPSVVVSGDRVNKQCEAAMARAGRGDIVTISEIKTKIEGSNILPRATSPAFYEIQ